MKELFIKLLEKAATGTLKTTHGITRSDVEIRILNKIFTTEAIDFNSGVTYFINSDKGKKKMNVYADGFGAETYDLTDEESVKVAYLANQIIEIDRKRATATLNSFLLC